MLPKVNPALRNKIEAVAQGPFEAKLGSTDSLAGLRRVGFEGIANLAGSIRRNVRPPAARRVDKASSPSEPELAEDELQRQTPGTGGPLPPVNARLKNKTEGVAARPDSLPRSSRDAG